jgi:hypothetical protein
MQVVPSEIIASSITAAIMTVATIGALYSERQFGGYFFGRPIWFMRKERPLRFAAVILFCAIFAACSRDVSNRR